MVSRLKTMAINISRFNFRYWWLVLISLLIHKLPFLLFAPADAVLLKRIALPVSLLLLLFALSKNLKLFSVRVMAIGVLMNFIAIVVNGGLMPVTPEARIQAQMLTIDISVVGGVLPEGSGILLPVELTRMWFLTDIIPVPAIRGVLSIGDLVILLGLAIFIGEMIRLHYPREVISQSGAGAD